MTHGKMSRSLRSGAFAALVTLLAAFPSVAQTDVTIRWAAGAFGNEKPVDEPVKNVTGAPDGKGTEVSRPSWLATVTAKQKFTYTNLAAMLDGVTADDLKSYDLIAFEGNSSKKPFANSVWFVTDNVTWAAGTFLGDAQPLDTLPPNHLRFRAGVMSTAKYMQVFKNVKELKNRNNQPINWVGWILVDIPDTMKMDLVHLKLFLTGVWKAGTTSKFDGAPNPDAIGVIVH